MDDEVEVKEKLNCRKKRKSGLTAFPKRETRDSSNAADFNLASTSTAIHSSSVSSSIALQVHRSRLDCRLCGVGGVFRSQWLHHFAGAASPGSAPQRPFEPSHLLFPRRRRLPQQPSTHPRCTMRTQQRRVIAWKGRQSTDRRNQLE